MLTFPFAPILHRLSRGTNWTKIQRAAHTTIHHRWTVEQDVSRNKSREVEQRVSAAAHLPRGPEERSNARRTHVLECSDTNDQSNDERKEPREKVNVRYEHRVSIANRYSTSSMRTLSTRLFNIVGVISFTWTVIRLPAATLLNAATLLRFGVSSGAPNGCFSRAMT